MRKLAIFLTILIVVEGRISRGIQEEELKTTSSDQKQEDEDLLALFEQPPPGFEPLEQDEIDAITQPYRPQRPTRTRPTRTFPSRTRFPCPPCPNRPNRPNGFPTRFSRPPPMWLSRPGFSPTRPVKDLLSDVMKPIMEIQNQLEDHVRSDFLVKNLSNTSVISNPQTMLEHITALQTALTGVMSEIQRTCSPSMSIKTFPSLDLVKNISAENNAIAKHTIDLWSKQSALGSGRSALNKEEIISLQADIIEKVKELLPKLSYIEHFDEKSANNEDWVKLTETIRFVTVCMKDKTLVEVLGPERVERLLDTYEQYLNYVDGEKQ